MAPSSTSVRPKAGVFTTATSCGEGGGGRRRMGGRGDGGGRPGKHGDSGGRRRGGPSALPAHAVAFQQTARPTWKSDLPLKSTSSICRDMPQPGQRLEISVYQPSFSPASREPGAASVEPMVRAAGVKRWAGWDACRTRLHNNTTECRIGDVHKRMWILEGQLVIRAHQRVAMLPPLHMRRSRIQAIQAAPPHLE